MRPQYGAVVSTVRGKLLSLSQVRAELAPADRAASLVTVPRDVRIVDRDAELIRRVERRWRHG